MGDERRRSPRYRAYLPVRIRPQGSARVTETLTRDLSEGGLRCLSPIVSPVASDVEVELTLGTGAEAVSLKGRTTWFQAISDSDQFDLGIAFADVAPPDQRRLSTYLERLASRPPSVPA
jgi:c-di-GMP-binding flagellar brake protein YcgR